MAGSEVYLPLPGVMTGPRGVVVDLPCSYNFQSTVANFNAIASGFGVLHTVTIFPVATATVTIWDNLVVAGGNTVFQTGALAAGNPINCVLDLLFTVGLSMTIGTAAALVTLTFRQR